MGAALRAGSELTTVIGTEGLEPTPAAPFSARAAPSLSRRDDSIALP